MLQCFQLCDISQLHQQYMYMALLASHGSDYAVLSFFAQHPIVSQQCKHVDPLTLQFVKFANILNPMMKALLFLCTS